MQFTRLELETMAKKFLKEAYNLPLNIPIKVNGRLTRTLGRFKHLNGIANGIDISKNMLMYYSKEEIISTLKHECIHYALFVLNQPYKDGEPYFESELVKHGAQSTGTKQMRGKQHVYTCDCFNMEYKSTRKMNVNKWRCSNCKGSYVYQGMILTNIAT